MLAYYLKWHMRRSLAPMLFDEPDPAARAATDGEPLPAHSFHTLLGDLTTLTRNVVRLGRDRLTAILATPPAHSTAPSICSASRPPRRQTDKTRCKLDQWLVLIRGHARVKEKVKGY
jgi:hypothetical protein